MDKLIIGLCGLAGSGKDTIADRLVERYGFVKMANADLLKRMAQNAFNFTDAQLWGPSEMRNAPDKRYPREHGPFTKDGKCSCCGAQAEVDTTDAYTPLVPRSTPPCFLTPRFALQSLGTEWGRTCFPDIWVKRVLEIANELLMGRALYTGMHGIHTRGITQSGIKGVAITDVRFLNEVEAIKASGGKVVRVIRGVVDGLCLQSAGGGWVAEHGGEDPASSMLQEATTPFLHEVPLHEHTSISAASAQHRSETELLSIPRERFDYVFHNSGDLHFLRLQTDRMMDVFKGKLMAFDRGLQDAPPFLREKCKALAVFMSELSQKYYEQDWADILPYALWNALHDNGNLTPGEDVRVDLTNDDLAKLKELSDAVPGWFVWSDKSYDAPYFIRRGAWLEQYEKRQKAQP